MISVFFENLKSIIGAIIHDNLDNIGASLQAIGWVFLPILVLPLLALLFSSSVRLNQILVAIVRLIDSINIALAESVKYVLVAMVLGVSFSVFAVQIFGLSWTKLDESALYFQAIVILLGSGATLLAGQHVRVDIFHTNMTPRAKALVDIIGFYALLMPFCLIIIWNMQGYVAISWASFEGSPETDGIRGMFILKTFISVFAVSMLAQGFAIAARAALLLTGKTLPPRPRGIELLFGHHDIEGGL